MGVVKNLVVQVGGFIIPSHFVMLEIDYAEEISLIPDWPSLATTQANINATKRTITLKVDGKKVEFDLYGIATTLLMAYDQTMFPCWLDGLVHEAKAVIFSPMSKDEMDTKEMVDHQEEKRAVPSKTKNEEAAINPFITRSDAQEAAWQQEDLTHVIQGGLDHYTEVPQEKCRKV